MEELVGARGVSWALVTVATTPSTVGENAPSDQNRFVTDQAPDDGLDSYLEIDLGWALADLAPGQIWNPGPNDARQALFDILSICQRR